MNHDDLYEAAKAAVRNLFSDMSVPAETTKESLETLVAEIEELISIL